MKRSAIIAIIITMVVVSPAIVGYALPSGEVTDTSYKADGFMNITDELSTDDIPIYNRYTGSLNNNKWINAQSHDRYFDNLYPVEITSSPNAYPVVDKHGEKSLTLSPQKISGRYTPELYCEMLETDAFQGYFSFDGMKPDTYGCGIIWIFSNGQIDGLDYDDVYHQNIQNVYLTAHESAQTGQPFSQISVTSTSYILANYADPSKGWHAQAGYQWRSVQGANAADVLIHFNGSTSKFVIGETLGDYRVWSLEVAVNDANEIVATLKTYSNEVTPNEPTIVSQKTIGSYHAYHYFLIKLHRDKSLDMSVSGLIGMKDFVSEYRDKIGSTASFELAGIYETAPRNAALQFKILEATSTRISVASSDVLSGHSWGIVNRNIEPSYYLGDCDWLITLNNVAVFGTSLSISTGSYGRAWTVDNGSITVDGQRFLVNGLEIMSISDGPDKGVWFNKTKVMDDKGVSSFLSGNWICKVTISEIEPVTVKKYVWSEGSFNLDYDGFCKIGLIASAASFIVTGLIGRRDGGNAAIAAVASAICGLVYIILLMH